MPSPVLEDMGEDNAGDVGVSYDAKLCENNDSASSTCDWRGLRFRRYENRWRLMAEAARAAARCKSALIRWN